MSTRQTNITYEAVTAAGVTVQTFSDDVLARTWVSQRRESLPGAYVEEVTTTVVRTQAYKPRLRVVAGR